VRKNIGVIMLGLSGALLLAAFMAVVWAPGVAEKTPLDVDTTTLLDGEAAKLDSATGELVANPVKAESVTRVDSNASDDDVTVFVQTSCLVIDDGNAPGCVEGNDPRLISADVDVFATDRVTAVAVNDPQYLPADAVPHEGLVNKFPFDTQAKDYPYWDSTLGGPVNAVYEGEETIQGIETFKFVMTVEGAEIDVAEGVPGTYDNVKEMYVEPRTGAIIDQVEDRQYYLEDGTQALDLQLSFTDEQVDQFARDADDNIGKLDLMTRTVPLIGFIGGGLLLVLGLVLAVRGGGLAPPAPRPRERQPVGVA
jgi:hypothetical protein